MSSCAHLFDEFGVTTKRQSVARRPNGPETVILVGPDLFAFGCSPVDFARVVELACVFVSDDFRAAPCLLRCARRPRVGLAGELRESSN